MKKKNLMSGVANFAALKTKYNNFEVPDLEVIVGTDKLIAGLELIITELNVDLTCGFEASGCDFAIGYCYDVEKDDFIPQITSKLSIGSKVEVLLGYGDDLTSVFSGYIDTVSFEFNKGTASVIHVNCMDAKGLLMKNRRLEAFKETKTDAVVKSLLSEQPVSAFLTGKTVDPCAKEEVPLRTGMKTDYDIIVEQAQKMGFEFFIIQGRAYFTRAEKVTAPIMTITPEFPLTECEVSFSVNKMSETVEVRSINQENGEMISGKAKISLSQHLMADDADKLYKGTTQVYYEAGVDSASEASKRARVRMNAAKANYGSLALTLKGLPELVSGRFIKLDKFAGVVDGKYYITSVTHSFTNEGYFTTVHARRKM